MTQVFRCPHADCRAPVVDEAIEHVDLCGFSDWSAQRVLEYHGVRVLERSIEASLDIGDRRELHAFAAFLRYAGPHGERKVTLHQEWFDWAVGKGPCPDPGSEVGPDPYVAP